MPTLWRRWPGGAAPSSFTSSLPPPAAHLPSPSPMGFNTEICSDTVTSYVLYSLSMLTSQAWWYVPRIYLDPEMSDSSATAEPLNLSFTGLVQFHVLWLYVPVHRFELGSYSQHWKCGRLMYIRNVLGQQLPLFGLDRRTYLPMENGLSWNFRRPARSYLYIQ